MLVNYLLQITVWLLLFPAPNHAQEAPGKVVTSPHGALAIPCQNCHTANGWKPIRTVPEFDHNKTRYPLRGMHEGLACTQCHTKMIFTDVGKTCSDCHADLHRGKMGANCEQCHNVKGWKVATKDIQNHNNRFPLIGAHAMVQCEDCHKNGGLSQFNTMSTACYSCHAKDYQNTRDVNHVALKLPIECTQCHNQNTWAGAAFDHLRYTGYALTGAHAQLDCALCHVGGRYAGTPTACVGCHLNNFQKSTNPNHVQFNLPQTCEQCHTTAAWAPAKFDHNLIVAFPLTGKHATLSCDQCHANSNFQIATAACVSCHLKDFQATNAPNHVQAGFPQTCEQCHTTTDWTGATFDHAKTGFALTGAHTTLPCAQCHVSGNYAITVTTCVSCHLKDFQGTTAPNHVQANLPQACEQCHTTTNWTGATFDHSKTGFPLTGAHVAVQCATCHVNNNYNLTSAACVNCHLQNFQATTNPNHVSGGFPQTCEQCHNTTAWTGAAFDHSTTGFPLTGAHTPLACTQCHVNNNYNLSSAACVTCHQTNYDGTADPPHAAAKLPTTCDTCHTTVSWLGATFNHAAPPANWALTGFHTSLTCAQCHVSSNYTLTSGTCVNCHLADYQKTTNPNHVTGGFPQTCDQCHNTTAWTAASFDHSKTGFPLTGAHVTVQCTLCHVNNNYNITDTSCVSCHLQNFQATTNPNHVTSGFPQTCEQCHTTTAWTGAVFNHAAPPANWALTGAHSPLACTQCHVNNNYNLTSTACVTCHQTNYDGTTDPPHAAAKLPTTCDTCHTTVNWLGATFNHSAPPANWALTGFHTSLTCAQCHVSNNYSLTSTACVTCHLANFQSTTNPNHVTSGFPQTCEQCHNTTAWTGATFNHAAPPANWALTGTHATTTCTQCHVNNNYNLTSTACVTCHQTNYDGTTDPPHAAAKLPTTCDTCHSTTNWLGATFNHAAPPANWALTGFHTSLTCAQCHTNNNYSFTNGACVQCHLANYNSTTNPNHVTSGFPQTCEQCHTTTAWTGATFNHAAPPANWALTGTHATTACTLCHVNNNYNLTSTVCVTCHQTDYNNAKTPVDHVSANFPTTCDTCHDTVLWTDGKFDHTATGFTLDGFHTTLQCSQCHNATFGNYNITSNACILCHLSNFNGTTNPPHTGFPSTAQSCVTACHHTTTDWTGASFDHSQAPANWALVGGHTTVACASCHVNNNYSLTAANAANCDFCHDAIFRTATNPNHVTGAFPTTCTTCHVWPKTDWLGATLPSQYHTWFSASHHGATCGTDCHQNAPTDYSTYQCYVACHHHTKTATDNSHSGRAGYSYGTNGDTCVVSGCHLGGGNGG